MVTIELTQKIEKLFILAVRYSLGKYSNAAKDVIEQVKPLIYALSNDTISKIIYNVETEIDSSDQSGRYLPDKELWIDLLKELRKEKKTRKDRKRAKN